MGVDSTGVCKATGAHLFLVHSCCSFWYRATRSTFLALPAALLPVDMRLTQLLACMGQGCAAAVSHISVLNVHLE